MAEAKRDWMKEKWRPAMGWMYMSICCFDFVLFPILWSILQALVHDGVITSQWTPLTLQGAGLFHMAMGAILGVAAWTRGQEKLAIMSNPQAYGYPSSYDNYEAYQTPRTYMTRRGKIAPIIEEPEL